MAKPGASKNRVGRRFSLPDYAALWRGLKRGARNVLPRAYSAALMVVIVYLTFSAVRYLLTSLAVGGPPAQITELPTRLDRTLLATERSAWTAMEASEQFRTPLAHYHRLDSWIQPDNFNDCARGGCHAPLPHSKRKEVRAFLNMHATSLHCGVCHIKTDERPMQLVWYDLASGKPRNPPSILEAFGLITASIAPSQDDAAGTTLKNRLVSLLRASAEEAGNMTALSRLADHVDAVRAGSEPFNKLITAAREILPRHFRGEYGAKLAQRNPKGGGPILGHPNTEAAIKAFLNQGQQAQGKERDDMLAAVHPLKRDQPLQCTNCHTTDVPLIDFAKAGYPEARFAALINPVVFRMIEHINSGRPMHLPQLGAHSEPRTGSAIGTPSSSPDGPTTTQKQ